MPIRVKCRCGQELVLRYGDWMYLLLGLVLVAVILNTAALLVLSFHRLDHDGSESAPSNAVPPEEAKEPPRPESARGDGSPADTGGGEETAGQPNSRGGHAGRRHLGEPAAPPKRSLLEQLELLSPPPEPEETPPPIAEPERPSSPHRELVVAAPLARLLLLKRASTADMTLPWLLDSDPRLRGRALEQALAQPPPAGSLKDAVLPIVIEAAPFLRKEPPGRELLSRFGLSAEQLDTSGQMLPAPAWEKLRSRVENQLILHPECDRLRKILNAVSVTGADLLFAIDTTQSMARALDEVKTVAAWLLPALEWGTPGVRIGLLLYKDEVEDLTDLSTSPGAEILPRVLAVYASGGGRPPEGLYVALRAALELGRITWRSDAEKHLVFVGDAPLDRRDKRSFESLATAAHQEGGFRIHTLGVQPQEGREKVPYFEELARAGGGRSVTCDGNTLGAEIMTCLFGEKTRSLVDALAPELQRMFRRED